jgi:hypothetical protein
MITDLEVFELSELCDMLNNEIELNERIEEAIELL